MDKNGEQIHCLLNGRLIVSGFVLLITRNQAGNKSKKNFL